MTLCIFTATYNRASLLPRLYRSLLLQTDKRFEWCVVDDGSQDNTGELIAGWQDAAPFPILYVKQSNQGKHAAFLTCIKATSRDIIFIVDSDDLLPPGAVELIHKADEKLQDESIAGIVGFKVDTQGKLLGRKFPEHIERCSWLTLQGEYGMRGEYATAYKRAVLTNFVKHPYEGEKFMPEGVFHDAISMQYQLLLCTEVLTVCEYQESGYSVNYSRIMVESPQGFKLWAAQRIDIEKKLFRILKLCTQYWAFYFLDHKRINIYKGRHTLLLNFAKPFGFLLAMRYLRKSSTTGQ